MEEKEKKNIWKDMPQKTKALVIGIVVVLILAIITVIVFLSSKPDGLTTITKSSLAEIVEKSDLVSVEYTYNSTTSVKDGDGNEKYYVAYKGRVRVGFDFEDITVANEGRNIVITIPQLIIQSCSVGEEMEYIFLRDEYNTETTYQEAYKAACADLENKAENNESLLAIATENALETMKAFIKPFEDQLAEGYTIVVKEEDAA